MTIRELSADPMFEVINAGADQERTVESVYCCDLLSVAMGKAPAQCAWVTVMGNSNTLAVVALTDAACVILACGTKLDDAAMEKAAQQGITVLGTREPIFETALRVYQMIHG